MKVIVMAGTRPEAIKVAPVIHELYKYPKIDVILCNTGQHKEMIEQAFADFDIEADIHLNVMKPNQTLASLSSRLFEKIDSVFMKEKPDWVLVQGDTTTVMVSSLCAFYQNIKIGHIEAGLRSFNKRAPFPEEVNRQIVSKIADLHFTPTQTAYANLIRDGVEPDKILVTGNTVIDALHWIQEKIKNQSYLLPKKVSEAQEEDKRIILVTGHRRENLGFGFIEICHAVRALADRYEDVLFVYPVHLNPQVAETVNDILGGHPRILLCPPLPYKRFIALLSASYFVLTDSGGIQEEAPALGKPVLVMRDVTERPEGIKAGVAKLVGAEKNQIIYQASILLENREAWNNMVGATNPYGNGKASFYIVESLLNERMI